jgi:hypothetical protein
MRTVPVGSLTCRRGATGCLNRTVRSRIGTRRWRVVTHERLLVSDSSGKSIQSRSILGRSENSADASGPLLRLWRSWWRRPTSPRVAATLSRSVQPHMYGRGKTRAPTRRDTSTDRQHGYKPDRRPGDSLMGRVRAGRSGLESRVAFCRLGVMILCSSRLRGSTDLRAPQPLSGNVEPH